MEFNKEEFLYDKDSPAKQIDPKPNAWCVDDDDNLEQNDLEGRPGDADINPVMEGKPMGGHGFGENNVTPSGDDKNNPSQNGGYSNPYFARTELSELFQFVEFASGFAGDGMIFENITITMRLSSTVYGQKELILPPTNYYR